MLKIFFTVFFIAELIVAVAIILKIYRFNKLVIAINDLILINKDKLSDYFEYFRLLMAYFVCNLLRLNKIFLLKKQKSLFRFFKTFALHGVISLLRSKHKKIISIYRILKEIYEGIRAAEI